MPDNFVTCIFNNQKENYQRRKFLYETAKDKIGGKSIMLYKKRIILFVRSSYTITYNMQYNVLIHMNYV